MDLLIFLLSFVGFSFGFQSIERRIFQGKEVDTPFKYPFLASLQTIDLEHFCGGSLIKPNIILTASHCFDHYSGIEIHAVVHRYNIRKFDNEEDGIRSKVIEIKSHPKYNYTTYLNDITLCKLETPITIETHLSLDNFKGIYDSTTTVKFIGWGQTSHLNHTLSKILLESQVPIYPIDQCKKDLLQDSPICANNQLCTGSHQFNPSPCRGDSGGPLIIYRSNQMVLVGIISWGQNCSDPNQRAVYTRVSSYLDWIDNNI